VATRTWRIACHTVPHVVSFDGFASGQQPASMAEVPAPTPIAEWPDYSVMPTGGDVMTTDLNAPYDKGDLCWLLVSSVLCWYGDEHP
jgi:hypothetical protein